MFWYFAVPSGSAQKKEKKELSEKDGLNRKETDMSEQKGGQEQKKGNTGRVLLLVCAVVIIVLLAAVVFLLMRGNGGAAAEDEAPKRNVVVNEENAEEVAEEILNQKVVAPGTYQVTMNSTWNFQNGASSSDNAYVENSTANTNPVYFDLQLTETEEVIYESPVIPVGSHLDDIRLDTDLDAGTYDCVLTYHLVDEEQNTLSTLRMAVTVVVAE